MRDGLGIKQLIAEIAIVSGRDSPALRRRAADLVLSIFTPVSPIRRTAAAIQRELNVGREETAALGDDLPDLPLFEAAALRIAPADAEPEILALADFITGRAGGHGAVRDAARHILAQRPIRNGCETSSWVERCGSR